MSYSNLHSIGFDGVLHYGNAEFGRYPMIIMQFTGLRDKNGKEIYEGDIVLASDEGKYKVCCDVWLCMGIMPLMGRGFVSFTELAGRGNVLDFEIVGNIYESDLSTTK
jgi:hypothetical protein